MSEIVRIEIVHEYFKQRKDYVLSVGLPVNPATQGEENHYPAYNTVLKEYRHTDPVRNQDDPKWDFPKDGNEAWKLHLNIRMEHVKIVSEYLIREGYYHKYLQGGEIEQGKIFTLYIGSHELAKRLSERLSQDLKEWLCLPLPKDEIELARGVVGRFNAGGDLNAHGGRIFHQYGPDGFSLLYADVRDESTRKFDGRGSPTLKERTAWTRNALEAILNQYGSYFFQE